MAARKRKRTTSLDQAVTIAQRKSDHLSRKQRQFVLVYNDWKKAQRVVDRWIRKITNKALEGVGDDEA